MTKNRTAEDANGRCLPSARLWVNLQSEALPRPAGSPRLPSTKLNSTFTKEITMNLSCARSMALCLLAGVLAGLSGCKSSGVEAAGNGSAAEMSGPPTYNAVYQVRNPRVCAKVTRPPTVAQATALVQCWNESDTTGSASPAIVVATDLQVEMGAPRNYIPGTDDRQDLDPSAKIYPLRGQGTRWSCGPVPEYPAGQNCMMWPAGPGGQGSCWRTTFGDWNCSMSIGSTKWMTKQKGPTTY
jgi:hypothetical protein